MNRDTLALCSIFLLLVLLQVMLFNNLYLFGFINPMVYLFFIVVYRFENDQTLFILLSFLLGFAIDFTNQSQLPPLPPLKPPYTTPLVHLHL